MDLTIQVGLSILFILCATAFIICTYSKKNHRKAANKKQVPRADGALPIIGHLHQFRKGELLFKKLASMADKYGPAFTVKLGSLDHLVVSSMEMAKECFTTHDRVFCDRPKLTATKLLGYNWAMFGVASYGSYWREMRRITTLELLSNRRIDMLRPLRASEVKTYLKELYDEWAARGRPESGVLVDMKRFFGDMMLSSVVRMVDGKSLIRDGEEGETNKTAKLMRDFTHYLGVLLVADSIPILRWIDRIIGQEKVIKKIARDLDNLMEAWLDEHKQKRKTSSGVNRTDQDFMDVMLTTLKDFKCDEYDEDTVNKATCVNVIFAASDTTMVTLTWALSLLLNSPEKLKKAQDELDKHVPRHRPVEEADLKNLEYLQAVVKETLRLYPPVPIIGMRSALDDCTLSTGHHVPKGTRLMVNAWKIHHDPSVWPEPSEFRPERFLTTHKDVDVLGKNYEFIPFGSGRRCCPGIALGLRTVHLALASLLHCYEFARPCEQEIDMSESLGLTSEKATPLEVCVRPRLDAAEVYAF